MHRNTDLTADRSAAGPHPVARPVAVEPVNGAGPPPTAALPAGHVLLPEGQRIYAVGDVHGCLRELLALEAVILADAADAAGRAVIVMLGDYVDRGPDSAGAVHHLVGPPPPGITRLCLRGNHDDYLLGFLADPVAHIGWLDVDGRGTLASYGVAVPRKVTPAAAVAVREAAVQAVPPDHVAFLQGLPLVARAEGFVFVHAGLRPGVPLEAQDPADLLLSGDWHLDRRSGDLPFRVVHGHTVRFAPLVDERRVAVDTGAFRTGRLTAARIDGGAVTFLDSTGRATRPVRGGHAPLRVAPMRPAGLAAPLAAAPYPSAPQTSAPRPSAPLPSAPPRPPLMAPGPGRARAIPRAVAVSAAGLALFGLAGTLLAAGWSSVAPAARTTVDPPTPASPAPAEPAPFRSLERDLEAALRDLRAPTAPSGLLPDTNPPPKRPGPTGTVEASALAALVDRPASADIYLPASDAADSPSPMGSAVAALPVEPSSPPRPDGLPGAARPIVPATAAFDPADAPAPDAASAAPLPRPRPTVLAAAAPAVPGVIAALAGDNPLDGQTPRLQAFDLALSACCGAPAEPSFSVPPAAPSTSGRTAAPTRAATAETTITRKKPTVRSAKRTKRPRRLRQRVVRRPALDFAVDDDRPAWVIARDRARNAAAVDPANAEFATRPGSRSGSRPASGTGGRASADRRTDAGTSASAVSSAAGGGGQSAASGSSTTQSSSTSSSTANASTTGPSASAASGSASSGPEAGASSGSPSGAGPGSGAGTGSGPVGSAVGGVAGGASSVGQAVGRGLGGLGRGVGGALGGGGRGGEASDKGGRDGSKGGGDSGRGGGRGEGGRGDGGRGGGRGRD
ncbi:metallophosphoesterase family protein [Mongoliimonas terrestris]|uniref:metallophosphoesterase family protein n=1 Tax=Mongoliimonas terrestris TaxID=1709001 RepID=UPI0009495334|nr:metallophosphoesterase family protein [Mongoliimonas terrestris]